MIRGTQNRQWAIGLEDVRAVEGLEGDGLDDGRWGVGVIPAPPHRMWNGQMELRGVVLATRE